MPPPRTDDTTPVSDDEKVGSYDYLDRLQMLTELRDAGTLTEGEFATEKARILAER